MWTRTHSVVTKEATKEQIWQLLADVNNWPTWDEGIESAKLEGEFRKGNYFQLRPKGGPNVKIEIIESIPNKRFTDLTRFPLAKMTGDHLLEETSEGLRLTTTMTVTGILSFLWVKLVAQKIVSGLPHDTQVQIQTASRL
jgi:hypothetical protein